MQDMCLLAMSLAMFGQNRFLSALSLIDVVPWCAACSVSSALLLGHDHPVPHVDHALVHSEHVLDPLVELYVRL
jgi:hypothetical protein